MNTQPLRQQTVSKDEEWIILIKKLFEKHLMNL
jgi:hypothetical protein